MDSAQAKQFLMTRVIEEAEVEQVSFSDLEKKMLAFSEVYPSLPDIYEVNAEFERDYDSGEYEAKVAGLLKRARERDKSESAGRAQRWSDALGVLRREDHYILVMAGQAFGSAWAPSGTTNRLRDFLIYVGVGLAVVVLILLYVAYHR